MSALGVTLNQHQYDALASLSYNIGVGWLTSSYRLYNMLAAGIQYYTDEEIVNTFARYSNSAAGGTLDALVERRLDNVVYRLGFAKTRRDARQLVSHNHFTVNGKRVNIPSYQVKAGDVIEVRESSRSSAKFAKLTGAEAPVVALPAWLNRETGSLKVVVAKLPERSDIDYEVAEHLIVELYSK